MAIFIEFMHCVNTPSHSQILPFFQNAGEMSNSHMYKVPQNNLYSYHEYDCSQFEKDSYFRKQRENNCSNVDIPTCRLILWYM